MEDCFLSTGRVCARRQWGMQGGGRFCALTEEAALEPCDASFICSIGRRKEAELSFSCLRGHWWHWVDRGGGEGGEGEQGGSCLLSVVFEWCYLIDWELTTRRKQHLPGDSSRNSNSRGWVTWPKGNKDRRAGNDRGCKNFLFPLLVSRVIEYFIAQIFIIKLEESLKIKR